MMKRSLPAKSTRRDFIQRIGYALTLPSLAMRSSPAGPAKSGNEDNASIRSGANPQPAKPRTNQKKLGIALVGLGNYSTHQLAPALKETKNCYLAGIVSGSPDKMKVWKRKYDIPDKNIYNYQDFDSIKDNPDIDIVYVVLPNSMHATFTMRAARAGKDVICEKPMAISVQECEDMIRVCRESDRLLSVGYRLHFEPHNLAMADFSKSKNYGKILKLTAQHGFDIEQGGWRLDKALAGGGPLMDVGIYCVQAAIYVSGKNPVAVMAQEGNKTDTVRFKEVEQSMKWQMEFEDGLVAACETSYASEMDMLKVACERGWSELKPAYAYRGIRGNSGEGKMKYPEVNQQALQMDDFAECVYQRKISKVSGHMGLRDVKILLAIYEAAATGKRIQLNNL